MQGWRKSEKASYQDKRAYLGPISREYANLGEVEMVRMGPNRPIGKAWRLIAVLMTSILH